MNSNINQSESTVYCQHFCEQCKIKLICTRWLPLRTAIISILRRSVAEYLVMPYGILIYTAAIT